MLKSVTVTNYRGASLKITLTDPWSTGFNITDIRGLGPGKADIRTTDITTTDGSLFNSARLPRRNIVIDIMFLPTNGSIEATRQKTYQYFPIKQPLTLLFETDNRRAEISGYVEENEPEIFSNSEATQISIICPDPYFYSAEESQVTEFKGVYPQFEFPFSNESLTEPLLIMGEIRILQEEVITYNGDSEIGVDIYIDFFGIVRNLKIHNADTRQTMAIDTDKFVQIVGSEIQYGDRIEIHTQKGKKSIRLLRDGQYTNILNALTRDSDWFQLAKGDNIFSFNADYGVSDIELRIENKIIYEGI